MKKFKLTPENGVFVYIALLLLTFTAYYFSFNRFGLYEDDYYFIADPCNSTFAQIIEHIKWVFNSNPEGRILGFALPFVLANAMYNLGGMPAVYLFGLIIVTTNGYLLYLVIKKTFPFILSLFTALLFLLAPMDTTKALLIHAYQLQISVLFLMTGLLLFLNKKFILSYFIAALSLITYETAFLPFFFAPAFANIKWREKEYIWRQIRHAFVFALIIILVFMSRKIFKEARLEEVVISDALFKTLKALLIGPVVSVFSYLNAAVKALAGIKITIIFILPSFILLFIFFHFLLKTDTFSRTSSLINLKSRVITVKVFLDEDVKISLKAIVLGGIMLVFSYLLSAIHYPPIALTGRETSVHLPASISSAVMFGGFFYLLYFVLRKYNLRHVFTIIISLVLSFLIGYGRVIQKDFMKSWEIQKDFWRQVVELCPDLEEGTAIVVDREDLPETEYIYSHSWSDPVVLEDLFRFPDSWETNPRLIIDEKNPFGEITTVNGKIFYKPRYPFLYYDREMVELQPGNTIFLERTDGKYSRLSDSIIYDGTWLKLKPEIPGKALDFPRQNLYDYFFSD
ncbi:MAG: hypothetical protein JW723_13795 [Bacteroidales bacterium]|nr:hypothetical protein [Bacteroidales bacterium]